MATILPTYTTATLPKASASRNCLVTVTDGADGKPCAALSDGTAWRRLSLGPAVSAKPVVPPPAPPSGIDFSRATR